MGSIGFYMMTVLLGAGAAFGLMQKTSQGPVSHQAAGKC